MDEQVLAAMARWPEVPDVYGWLSLTFQGHWRVHADGQGNQKADGQQGRFPPGEAISNEQILGFINRNYMHDEHGRWYFQNGPQRVYVRLDAAPFILRTQGAGQDIKLITHTERTVTAVEAWTLDNTGRLFATTEYGVALIDSRDLETVLGGLSSAGQPLEEILEQELIQGYDSFFFRTQAQENRGVNAPAWWSAIDFKALPKAGPASFNFCPASKIPENLGFIANPRPIPSKNS